MGIFEELMKDDTLNIDSKNSNDNKYFDILHTLKFGVNQGKRNVALTQVAGVLRNVGLTQEFINHLLLALNGYHHINLSRNEIGNIAQSIAQYEPKAYNYESTHYNYEPTHKDILDINDLASQWKECQSKAGNCKTGFNILDAAITCFNQGEVLTVAGRSGTLKTTFGLTLAKRYIKNLNTSCLFVSLEMNASGLFFRIANQTLSSCVNHPYTGNETYNILINEGFKETITMSNENMLFVDKDSLTIKQIEQYLLLARDKHQIDLLVIDYIGYIKDPEKGTNYEKISRIAKDIKGLAKRQNIRIILLCQTSRAGGDGTEEVKLHHLRDSGAIEESADIILGLWHAKEKDRLHSELLKCRHGERGKRIDFYNKGLNLVETKYQRDKKEF
jgi:replicative DNA helicase